jgi:tRNA-2-methylthio-N6-dimethylallyladenosine synthase
MFIHDFNVNWLINDLDSYGEVLAEVERIRKIEAINFPIQSGSDRILSLMRRPYNATDAVAALESVRKVAPSIALGTHVIIGFPSEAEADFQSTICVLDTVAFDFVTCFAYSEHQTTDSAHIVPKA